MPIFRYKAIGPNGDTHEGEMEELDAATVIRKIQDNGRIPLFAEEVKPGLRQFSLSWQKGVNSAAARDQVMTFTQYLASLLSAGIPLDRALDIMRDVEDDARQIRMIDGVQRSVRGGRSLSSTLQDQGGLFSKFYISLLRAAEASGELSAGFTRLAEYLRRKQDIHDRIVSSLIYPVILLLVSGISVIVLLTYVVPQFRTLFDDMGPALPMSTKWVLAISDFVASFGWVMLPILLVIVFVCRWRLSFPETRLTLDAFKLRLPLVGPLIEHLETARLSRTLGTLLQNGVPLVDSLSIAADALSNRVMINEIHRAKESIRQGSQLTSTLLQHRIFPKLAIQLMKVGEETGRLERTLLDVADFYDRELDVRIHRLLALVEPALIIGLGIMIALIIMSILVGIVSINDLPV